MMLMNSSNYSVLRSQSYQFFAGLLNQPLNDLMWEELVCWAKQTGESGFLTPVKQWVNEHPGLQADGLTSLGADYTRLFIGLTKEYGPPPPFQHLYHNVCQENDAVASGRLAVTQCYKDSNVNPLDPYLNASDHIVSELQYMFLLASQEARGAELIARQNQTFEAQLHELQLDFLQQHLLSWVHSWNALITRYENKFNFYSGMVTALVCFLEQDLNYLKYELSIN